MFKKSYACVLLMFPIIPAGNPSTIPPHTISEENNENDHNQQHVGDLSAVNATAVDEKG
jgi:hypothetical protein